MKFKIKRVFGAVYISGIAPKVYGKHVLFLPTGEFLQSFRLFPIVKELHNRGKYV